MLLPWRDRVLLKYVLGLLFATFFVLLPQNVTNIVQAQSVTEQNEIISDSVPSESIVSQGPSATGKKFPSRNQRIVDTAIMVIILVGLFYLLFSVFNSIGSLKKGKHG